MSKSEKSKSEESKEQVSTDSVAKPESFEQRVSYGFGWQFGRQMQKNRFEGIDIETAILAMRQCFNGQPSMLSEEELNEAYDAVKEKRMAFEKDRAAKYQDLCKSFLEQNKSRDGVQITDSGLQYEVLEAGDGATPQGEQVVKVHYHGSFIDGQVFDSSITRNEPAEFGLNDVIPGWTEALKLMNVGAKWRLFVPPHLGYGEMGSPPTIPANAVLIFEVHLIDIVEG